MQNEDLHIHTVIHELNFDFHLLIFRNRKALREWRAFLFVWYTKYEPLKNEKKFVAQICSVSFHYAIPHFMEIHKTLPPDRGMQMQETDFFKGQSIFTPPQRFLLNLSDYLTISENAFRLFVYNLHKLIHIPFHLTAKENTSGEQKNRANLSICPVLFLYKQITPF